MARPAPDRLFEVHGLEAWEFTIGPEDKTKLLFDMRDTRNFVVWYFFSEDLSEFGRFDLAATPGGKYDKQSQLGHDGLSFFMLKAAHPIRVDQFAMPRRAMILKADRKGDELAFRLKLRRKETAFFLDLIFDAKDHDPPADLLFPMFGNVLIVAGPVQQKAPLAIPSPPGFVAARRT